MNITNIKNFFYSFIFLIFLSSIYHKKELAYKNSFRFPLHYLPMQIEQEDVIAQGIWKTLA